MSEQWKIGNEFAPFHPSASHVDPEYRDGWNACYEIAAGEIERLTAALHAQPGPVSLDDVEWAGKVHLAEAIRERDELRRQLAEAGEAIARQAATIRGLTITRPAGPRG